MTAPSFSFTLADDPAAPITGAASAAPAPALAARPPVKRGLLRPFRLDGKGGFARVSGDALLEQKLENLLSIDGFPWAPNRTANLDGLRHMSASIVRVFAGAYIREAATRLLPELRVEEVSATDNRDGTVKIEALTTKVRDPAQAAGASRVLR